MLSGHSLFSLIRLSCFVCCANAVFAGIPNSISDYKHPEITKDSGPVELLLLTLNPPTLVSWAKTDDKFTVNDSLCVHEKKDVSFPCISECHFEYCWLTLKIPDIAGVNAIYVYSGPEIYATGVYKAGTAPSKDNYLSLQGPAVQNISEHYVELSWKVKKPEVSSQVFCSLDGSYHVETVNPTEDADIGEVTLNIYFEASTLKAVSCFLNVDGVSLISEYIVVWQADSPLFLTANGMEKNNRLLESTAGAYKFSWLVYVGNVDYAETYSCSDPSHVICSGVTTTDESGKCRVKWDEKSFQHTVTIQADTNVPVVRYCNIGENVLGKSIYLLEDGNEKLVQTFIWRRLNDADVYIKGTYYQMLWLQGVQPDDVMCKIKENILTCRIEPDNLRMYWLLLKSPSAEILDILTAKEAFTFTASLWRCYGHSLILDLEGSTQAKGFTYAPEYTDGQVNVSSAIFAILERTFQHHCESRTDYNVL